MNIQTIHQLIRHCYNWSKHSPHDIEWRPWDNSYGCSACPHIRVLV